jgi:integrase
MVSHQVDTWSAEFTDETGKVRRISTKTKNRSAAEQILARYEAEVARIKSGVVTREELTKAKTPQMTLDEALQKFRTKMVASGNTEKHIGCTMQQALSLLGESGIDSLAKIRRETIEKWIADEIKKKVRSSRTINAYLVSVKSFSQYLTDIELLPCNPLKPIRKLNQEIDQRKNRRAMTAEEIERLLKVAETREYQKTEKAKEQVLIYKLLLGTGLRSTELSLLTPSQIDFERNRLTIEAAKTKNKKSDVLPIRADLVQSVKDWVKAHGVQSHERIFHYDVHSIRRSFYRDLKAAGIERKDPDGRSIDVHSLRKTFGTMLARAGIPLTTVQRLMRHSTPLLTAKLYIDVDPVDMSQALEALPTF